MISFLEKVIKYEPKTVFGQTVYMACVIWIACLVAMTVFYLFGVDIK